MGEMKMKKTFLRIMCACLAFVMFAGIMPQTDVLAASAVGTPKKVKIAYADNEILLVWAKVKDAKGYAIYRSVNGGKYKKIDEVKDVIYSDEDDHKNGDKLSYYVKAYKKSNDKKVWSEKSKVVSRTFSNKDKYKKLRSAFKKYHIENGIENPEGTYTLGSMPDFHTIIASVYLEESDAVAFTYISDIDDITVVTEVIYLPNSDPYYTYEAGSADGSYVSGIFYLNLSKITKDTKVKLSDAFYLEGDTDGEFDHEAALNKSFKELNKYIKKYAKETKTKMSDFGFKNYK